MMMTFDEYDRLMEKMENLDTPPYLPTLEQLDMFEKDPDKWVLFCCYCHDRCGKPTNNDMKYRKRNLMDFINRHLELVDEEDAKTEATKV